MANGKRIGLTGGRGFIGQALKKYLKTKGCSITDYDCDLSNYDDVKSIVSKLGAPEIMIHLAGRFAGSKYELTRDNLIATWNLVDILSQYDGVNFVFGSTGAIYGDSGKDPITELSASQPNTDNGLIKHYCEEAISYYERKTSLSTLILRFPSVYGPGNSKGLMYHWLQSALNDHRIVINGDGSQCRSFVHVADICTAVYELIQSDVSGVFNVTHTEHYDLNTLASIFDQYFSFELIYAKADNDLNSMILSSSKLIEKTDWFPRSDIQAFIKTFI